VSNVEETIVQLARPRRQRGSTPVVVQKRRNLIREKRGIW
jgi:hypothetical protein